MKVVTNNMKYLQVTALVEDYHINANSNMINLDFYLPNFDFAVTREEKEVDGEKKKLLCREQGFNIFEFFITF